MGAPVLQVRNLGIRLAPDFAVVVSELDLAAGEVLVLDAPSGAGKSTVLGLVAGALPAADLPGRSFCLCGAEAVGSAGPECLGFVLQTSRLIPFLTLDENIGLPLRLAGRSAQPGWRDELVGRLGIGDLLGRMPDEVSVGQRQRAAVARAMLARPALLLLDEPVSALDPANVDVVERLIAGLTAEVGSAVLLASHQAQGGAFARAPRGGHRIDSWSEDVTVSVFSHGAGARPLAEVA